MPWSGIRHHAKLHSLIAWVGNDCLIYLLAELTSLRFLGHVLAFTSRRPTELRLTPQLKALSLDVDRGACYRPYF
jgi:hypothetical protein